MDPQQKHLLSFPPSADGSVYVSVRVSFRTEGTQCVISVHGVVFAHYAVEDRVAEAYAMIGLFESGYATQIQIAESFGYSVRSLRRYQERFQAGGVGALVRASGRPLGSVVGRSKQQGRDQTILHLKAKGSSNRAIAGKLGVSETAIRKRLRRLGWQPSPEPGLPFPYETNGDAPSIANVSQNAVEILSIASGGTSRHQLWNNGASCIELPPASPDPDPLDRSIDRLLAAMGLLEDAVPVFAHADSLPRAGVLLAIPSLVAS